jgi:beta-lactamase regulating signal transducer with metallopeptidase domain
LTEEAKNQNEEDDKQLKQSDFDYSNREGILEVMAVVAHELGHWAHLDSVKLLCSKMLKVYTYYFLFSFFLKNIDLAADFGF